MGKRIVGLKRRIAKKLPAPFVGLYKRTRLGARSLLNRVFLPEQLREKRGNIYIACMNAVKIPGIMEMFNHIIVQDLYGLGRMKKDSTVIDVGANIGLFSVFSAGRAKKVYAFEPTHGNFSILEKNIKDTKLGKKIIPIQKAVGEREGRVTINYVKQAPGASYIEGAERDRVETYVKGLRKIPEDVEMTTLDSFVRKQGIRVDFLKIDAEGYEPKVLEGARQILQEQEPTIAVSVYHSKWHPAVIVDMVKSINPQYEIAEKRRAGDEEVFILKAK